MLSHVFDYCKGIQHGSNLSQEHHHKAKDALRGCSNNKRQYTSIWDLWHNDEIYRESQIAINWSDAWVRYLDHTAKIDIHQTAPHLQRNRYNNLLYLWSVDEDHHLYQQDQDTKTQRKHWLACTRKCDKIAELPPSREINSILQCTGILSG